MKDERSIDIGAVEMVRRIRDASYEKLKGMTDRELVDYYASRSNALEARLAPPLAKLPATP